MSIDYAPAPTDLLALDPTAQDLLFRQARTANTFTDEPVSDEQLRAVYDLVKWGPTAMNQSPLRIVAVRPGEGRERLVPAMSGNNRPKTAAAPLTLILAADVDFHDDLPRLFPAVPGARDLFAGNAAGREQSARLSASLQAGYLITGIRAAGLAAGPMAGFDAARVEREFFPDGRHRVFLVINVGRPAADAYYPRGPRLEFDEVVSFA